MADSSKNDRSGLSSDERIPLGMHSKSGVANVGSAGESPASANVVKVEHLSAGCGSVDNIAQAFAGAGLGLMPKLAIKFSGASGDYYRFRAQIQAHLEDGNLALDPNRTLQFLQELTEGDARDLIKNCPMIRDKSAALRQALYLLEKAFGSRDVEFRELLRQGLEGPGVKKEHRAHLKLYIALQVCWIAAESSDSLEELNSNASVDSLFRRLPLELRKVLHSRAVKRNLGDRIPYEFIMNFVLEKAEAANSRWGRLLQEPTQSRAAASSKHRPVPLNLMQSENTALEAKFEGSSLDNSSKGARTCISCASKNHLLHRCNIFLRKKRGSAPSVGQRQASLFCLLWSQPPGGQALCQLRSGTLLAFAF